jgi:hypothetical protein
VTSTFANKTADALTALSPNLIGAPPTVDGVAAALHAAAASADDVERRITGAAVHWSRSWDETFPPELLDRVVELLRRP